ncbi:serine hydrolase [Phormidium sp. FACHB-1136]|uniref:serine hydrolase n=1 Tax=Phormidium sp. FACHB-1136 TaxID=2692848 RepID=UPI0016870ABA|nr:serine hydrolase [Phormidium sp. FACHB-1136]MBD2426986.1 serine hydrolase [Phormidium sp. FACHB-1136]
MKPFFTDHADLTQGLNQALENLWATFPALAPHQIAVTWVVYDPPYITNTGGALSAHDFWQHQPRGASYRGVELIYPASVVKLFYLVAAQEWLEQGMVPSSVELDRALRDMIVDSSNDATSLVMDVLTGTTSGPELPPGPFETWQHQRNLVNRFFQSLQWPEVATVNMNQKTWCDGPYGRERAFVGEHYENRNKLTTHAVARLIHSLAGGVAVSAARSQAMLALMQRDLTLDRPPSEEEDQVSGFIGSGLPPNATLYSKAGFTSQVRHDAAYIEIPGHHPFTLVIFTEGQEHSKNREIIPYLTQQLADQTRLEA